ncbi:MAG: glycoside hydrolase family 43 protein [Actinomycetota bacterium]|nr:glycoside hydrolase family 43 protein [Actinomycetota bacterium]
MTESFRNPVIAGPPGEDHGDPFVVKYLDAYYLYHSGETAGRRGISVHRSPNLVDWEFQGFALEPAEAGWAWSDLWAPEVVYERGTFYMYVAATRRREADDPPTIWQQGEGADVGRRLGLARSSNPLGPFRLDPAPLIDQWSIDGHPFRDDDGTMWLFYNVRTQDLGLPDVLPGTGTVCDRLVAPDRLAGSAVPVTLPSDEWEGVPTRDWYWNEAPYVLKRRGRYYQLYSGGAFSDDSYAVGFAHASSLRGPWRKDPRNPILRGRGRIRGPGHQSFVYGPDAATPYAVYHGYVTGDQGRKVHIDRLFWAGDRPLVVGPTDTEQPRPQRAVFDEAVPHWRAEVWALGSWIQVGGTRFALRPRDVWHQVEVVQADARYAVRIGGALRASQPGVSVADAPLFSTDGAIRDYTITSVLEDGGRHDLPEGSSYAWHWGGGGRAELAIAVRGAVELSFDGVAQRAEGNGDDFRLVRVALPRGGRTIEVHALGDGAAVADLAVVARRG